MSVVTAADVEFRDRLMQNPTGYAWCECHYPCSSKDEAHMVQYTGGFWIPQNIQSNEYSEDSGTEGILYTRPNPDNPRNVSDLNFDSNDWYHNWNDLDNQWNRNNLVLRRRLLVHLQGPFYFEGVCCESTFLRHPPSIFPMVPSGSERTVYFFVSSALVSQATRRKNLRRSNLITARSIYASFFSRGIILATKTYSSVSTNT